MQYRREIDGLRAVAVLPVILFHAGYTIFSGGYVGVDVFFVISGYLITSILLTELQSGTFSLLRFYERRARRILPALFFVILCTIPFALMWMLPEQFKDYARSVVAVGLFSSNILFWRESGYFAPSTEEKPLLHTWSLAVEEQYYLLFPLLLIGLWRFGRRPVFYCILILAALSLCLSEIGWRWKPQANFYLAPTRVWELFAGSLCAFILSGKQPSKNETLSLIGLMMIIAAIFTFDATTPFPSLYTLLPVVGSALIILYGAQGTITARLLSTRICVGIGLISYSAYLWHQPLFAFARIRSLYEPSLALMTLLAVLSLGLAYGTWRYVEAPFRRKTETGYSSKKVCGLAAASLCGLVAVGIVSSTQNTNWIKTLPKPDFAWEESVRQYECMIQDLGNDTHPESCYEKGDTTVLLWGDSHAASLYPGLKTLAAEQGFALTQLTQAGCPPILDLTKLTQRKNCNAINRRILEELHKHHYDAIILHAAWHHDTYPLSHPEFEHKVSITLANIKKAAPEANIIVMGPVPLWRSGAYEQYVNMQRFYTEMTERKHKDIYAPSVALDWAEDYLIKMAAQYDLTYVSPYQYLCAEGTGEHRKCLIARQEEALAFLSADREHLSVFGADLLVQKMSATQFASGF